MNDVNTIDVIMMSSVSDCLGHLVIPRSVEDESGVRCAVNVLSCRVRCYPFLV